MDANDEESTTPSLTTRTSEIDDDEYKLITLITEGVKRMTSYIDASTIGPIAAHTRWPVLTNEEIKGYVEDYFLQHDLFPGKSVLELALLADEFVDTIDDNKKINIEFLIDPYYDISTTIKEIEKFALNKKIEAGGKEVLQQVMQKKKEEPYYITQSKKRKNR